MNSGNRTNTLRKRQSGALKWVLIIAVPPLLAKLIVKNIPEGHVDFLISRFVTDMINWYLDFVLYNSGVIVLVLSNRPRAACSADFVKITHPITL